MISNRLSVIGTILLLGALAVCASPAQEPSGKSSATVPASAAIPSSDIVALREAMKADGRSKANVSRRRALKNTVRKAQTLLRENPEAPNRFEVLNVIFDCQKGLLAMHNNEHNRNAVFDTCRELAKAPDKYAEIRLEAELLLSEKELSDQNATLAERAEALAAMIERYKDTAAEAKSLLMGALIVQKLDARELELAILYTLDEKYSDDHEVIAFRRKHLKVTRLDLLFSGKFERADGTEIVFPHDAIGRMCLMVFWSSRKPNTDKYLRMRPIGICFP